MSPIGSETEKASDQPVVLFSFIDIELAIVDNFLQIRCGEFWPGCCFLCFRHLPLGSLKECSNVVVADLLFSEMDKE